MALYRFDNAQEDLRWGELTKAQRILQNCKNLLMCRMGEVPYDRLRGFDESLNNLPMEKLRSELLPELDRLLLWETRATVTDAELRMLSDGSPYIRVTVEINE